MPPFNIDRDSSEFTSSPFDFVATGLRTIQFLFLLLTPTKPSFTQSVSLQISRMSRPTPGGHQQHQQQQEEVNVKMDQLWKIALCAQNTDVSQKAIQILNSVYFGQGEEFLSTCMRSLKAAAQDLSQE
jgi:hypothetical protein